jgi:hypothetical protein
VAEVRRLKQLGRLNHAEEWCADDWRSSSGLIDGRGGTTLAEEPIVRMRSTIIDLCCLIYNSRLV